MRPGRFSALVASILVVGAGLLGGIALAATADGSASGVPAISDIESCVNRLDRQLDIGYDRIAARCPELAKQLERGAWGPWLPRGWKETGNDFSAGSLQEFRELVNRENALTGPPPRAPDIRSLKVVLNGLASTERESGWSRFNSWLRSILETRQETPDDSWFTRLVSHVGFSQSVREIVAHIALAAVLLLAGVIVVNEMRAAGVLPRRAGRLARNAAAAAAPGARTMEWADMERAHLSDKPRLLLGLIVRRLCERGYLPPAGALTVRELTKAARLPEPEDRTRLSELALAAERVRFSAQALPSERLDASIVRGRELLDRLDASTQG